MPSQAYANYAMGPLQVSILFQIWASHWFICHMLVSVMLFAFCFQVSMSLPCSLMGLKCWGLQHSKHLEYTLAGTCYSFRCSPAIPSVWWGMQFGCSAESHDPSAFPTWQEGSSFPGSVAPPDRIGTKSLVGIKPGDSYVVIRYQVAELLTPGCKSASLLNHFFWFHEQCFSINWLSTSTRVWGLLIFRPSSQRFWSTFCFVLTYSIDLQNQMHPLMKLLLYLLQSPQGFYDWLVQFLIILDCSLLLASNLVNYGAKQRC